MIALGPPPACPGPNDGDWLFQLDEMDDEIRVIYLELIQQRYLYAVYVRLRIPAGRPAATWGVT